MIQSPQGEWKLGWTTAEPVASGPDWWMESQLGWDLTLPCGHCLSWFWRGWAGGTLVSCSCQSLFYLFLQVLFAPTRFPGFFSPWAPAASAFAHSFLLFSVLLFSVSSLPLSFILKGSAPVLYTKGIGVESSQVFLHHKSFTVWVFPLLTTFNSGNNWQLWFIAGTHRCGVCVCNKEMGQDKNTRKIQSIGTSGVGLGA